MAIAKGEVIYASDILAVNATITQVPYNKNMLVTGALEEKELDDTVTFWIRNNLANNLSIFMTNNKAINVTLSQEYWVYDKDDNLLHHFLYTFDGIPGSNREDTDNYTLVPGFYKLRIRQYIKTPLVNDGYSRVTVTVKPADDSIIVGNKIRVYLEGYSDLAPEQLITVDLANSGLMTSELGTDAAHGGT